MVRRRLALLAVTVALISASDAFAQKGATATANLTPSEVVQRYSDALLAKDWQTSANLTDPEELARTKAAFLPIFEKDSTHRLAARVLGTPTQLVLSTLSDVDFNARLFSFFVATSSQGSALDRFQGINVYGVAQPDSDRAYVVYQWRLPAGERPIRGVQAMELRRVNGQWKLRMLADFEGLREFLASQSASRE